jgi:O-antigen/teichoic acid export membrane protein
MSVKRAGLNSAIATSAKLVGAFAAIKVLAIYLGPEGLGLIGQFMSVIAILTVMTSGGMSLGITRFVAEKSVDTNALVRIIRTASWITICCCLVITIFTLLGAEYLSRLLFGTDRYSLTLRLCCFFLLPLGFSGLGLAVINGRSETATLAKIQVGAAILGSIGIIALVSYFREDGGAIGLIWMAACPSVLITIWWLRHESLKKSDLYPELNKVEALSLLRYAGMMVFTVIFQNFTQIWIRSHLEGSHGWQAAGYWQAMTRMSDAYLQVFNVFLLAYLLPKLSQNCNREEAISSIYSTYRLLVIPLLMVLTTGYLLRDFVIDFLLSKNFSPVSELFLPQMVGDFFKIMAFIPGYLVIARGYFPLYLSADPIQATLLISTNLWLTPQYGALGACWAYAISYACYILISTTVLIIYRLRK